VSTNYTIAPLKPRKTELLETKQPVQRESVVKMLTTSNPFVVVALEMYQILGYAVALQIGLITGISPASHRKSINESY
jgi:hypothetical protein